ncbi:NAD-dependent epimerase/dehydratase family protein [Candidatus Roizmanbacteria bacterium]|nr:NAD-dependent epimerase/dehydratase family protein [Candidatus Roizmanbacteria bacterium]
MKKFIVLGTKGFLGSHMSRFLKKRGHKVRSISDVDLRDYKNVLNSIEKDSLVFHFAADMGGVGYFSSENYYPFITNILIDINVLRACEAKNVKRLFYPASACIYPPSNQPLSEDMVNLPAKPDQMYGWEKLTLTKLLRNAPFDVRVGILHTIFGEGQTWEGKKAKFPPAIVYKSLKARKTGFIEIWGNGKQRRTFLYIEDALEKIYEVALSNHYHGEVNISSDEVVTIRQCVDWICEYLKIKPKYIYDENRPSGFLYRGVDNSKYNTHYTYRCKYSTKQGFQRLTDWMKNLIYR